MTTVQTRGAGERTALVAAFADDIPAQCHAALLLDQNVPHLGILGDE